MSEEKIEKLQQQVIDLIKGQTELEKKFEDWEFTDEGQEILGRIEKLEKKLELIEKYQKTDNEAIRKQEKELSELKNKFDVWRNEANNMIKELKEHRHIGLKLKGDQNWDDLRDVWNYIVETKDVLRELNDAFNKLVDKLTPKEYSEEQDWYADLYESVNIDKLGGEKTVDVSEMINSDIESVPPKDSKPPRDCNDCYLYGECDHQGAYKKDGKWCYEQVCNHESHFITSMERCPNCENPSETAGSARQTVKDCDNCGWYNHGHCRNIEAVVHAEGGHICWKPKEKEPLVSHTGTKDLSMVDLAKEIEKEPTESSHTDLNIEKWTYEWNADGSVRFYDKHKKEFIPVEKADLERWHRTAILRKMINLANDLKKYLKEDK